ncbi:uncharacterized protein LOC125240576 [Leguminivora glycinivorella]|uniref:uncharacterized protein LOC125240576 n=1 Tax=Leguminivora glycinivorella TaxID=1035111 RepID=UPI00200C2178|nr:uncharacterized protein LOC125240576 [Leguminivora glycinivorella]
MSSKENCLACPHPIAREELLTCPSCHGKYHYACLGIPTEYFNQIVQNANSGWQCHSCNNVSRRRRGDNTPVRKHFERSPPAGPLEVSQTVSDADMSICDEPRQWESENCNTINQSDLDTTVPENAKNAQELSLDVISRLLDTKLMSVKNEFRNIDSKLSKTRDEIFSRINKEITTAVEQIKIEFTATTDYIGEQIKDIQADLATANNRMKILELENSRLSAEVVALKKNSTNQPNNLELKNVIEQMHLELNERDQELILNDLEITGVPERPGESTLHIVKTISTSIGITLDDSEVVSVERVGPPRTTNANSTRQNPRPLVLRLTRKTLRDNLLRSARVKRGLDTSSLGLIEHSTSRVYINERLTKTNRKLFWLARQAGSTAGWRTDGKDSRTVRIRSEKEIGRVFGVDPTTSQGK